jgi:hypothetical protein
MEMVLLFLAGMILAIGFLAVDELVLDGRLLDRFVDKVRRYTG